MEIDNFTILLLLTLACLLGYYRFFSRPEPLVHPLLLGKQSEVSSVRKQGESGVYRSWATGQGTPVSRCALQTRSLFQSDHRPDMVDKEGWYCYPKGRVGKSADHQLTVRPANALKTVHDIVLAPRPGSDGSSRSILGTEVSALLLTVAKEGHMVKFILTL